MCVVCCRQHLHQLQLRSDNRYHSRCVTSAARDHCRIIEAARSAPSAAESPQYYRPMPILRTDSAAATGARP